MWKDYIARLKKEWIGKKVYFENLIYTIVDVDYNGVLHIDKKSQHNDTTAVYMPYEAEQNLVEG